MGCPLHLLSNGGAGELQNRVWRAQLSALFPWVESRRQEAAERYAQVLQIDEQAARSGLEDVKDLELGAILHQVGYLMARDEREWLHADKRVRNKLAHREPAAARDLEDAILRPPPRLLPR